MKQDSNNLDMMILACGIIVCLAIILAMLGFKRSRMDSYFINNDARLYCLGMLLFAADNPHHYYPTNLDQTLPYLRKANFMLNGTNEFEILFQGSRDDLSNSIVSRIIVLRSEPWQNQDGKWARIYGFADGHSEAHFEPNKNFDYWESQHSATLNRNR
jgi:hypothetical protein